MDIWTRRIKTHTELPAFGYGAFVCVWHTIHRPLVFRVLDSIWFLWEMIEKNVVVAPATTTTNRTKKQHVHFSWMLETLNNMGRQLHTHIPHTQAEQKKNYVLGYKRRPTKYRAKIYQHYFEYCMYIWYCRCFSFLLVSLLKFVRILPMCQWAGNTFVCKIPNGWFILIASIIFFLYSYFCCILFFACFSRAIRSTFPSFFSDGFSNAVLMNKFQFECAIYILYQLC